MRRRAYMAIGAGVGEIAVPPGSRCDLKRTVEGGDEVMVQRIWRTDAPPMTPYMVMDWWHDPWRPRVVVEQQSAPSMYGLSHPAGVRRV